MMEKHSPHLMSLDHQQWQAITPHKHSTYNCHFSLNLGMSYDLRNNDNWNKIWKTVIRVNVNGSNHAN